ncbi:putative membrane protein [Modicisalibacter xianhensis]|uniref:Putative membrane protein n=2 Tax=Modicisalibacter xianhensis TaxID=442341 RepID=A0A4R8G5Q6_9GAMM|nr:putative membrane protein [Halomonas xianhensis]
MPDDTRRSDRRNAEAMTQKTDTDTVKEASKTVQLASDQTVLASERTYASWLRTGCAALIAGLAVMRFMADVLNDWETRIITFLLIAFSIFCFLIATWRLRQLQKWLPRSEIPHLPFPMSAGLSAMLTMASLFALLALWQMNGQ